MSDFARFDEPNFFSDPTIDSRVRKLFKKKKKLWKRTNQMKFLGWSQDYRQPSFNLPGENVGLFEWCRCSHSALGPEPRGTVDGWKKGFFLKHQLPPCLLEQTLKILWFVFEKWKMNQTSKLEVVWSVDCLFTPNSVFLGAKMVIGVCRVFSDALSRLGKL